MDYEILYRGAFAMLKLVLQPNEAIKAESGAMVAKDDSIDMESKIEGGLMAGLARKFAGESLFFSTMTARSTAGEILLAPAYLGEIADIQLNPAEPYLLQKDGFFVATSDVTISTKTQSLAKGLFSGEGFFIMRAAGSGTLFVSSYGAIHPIIVPSGKQVIIDNAHLVAWPEAMHYSLEKAAGWVASVTSGEGVVCRFRGPGTVYVQTRNPAGFANWLARLIAKRK
jgi:uncharacterized protein (TIGR00266 family)